ncbi:MAG: hypothetical protein GXO99_01135 [Nitrospirae bacterium]|nr:hypothetical protein [Nitrospirota bacterium]
MSINNQKERFSLTIEDGRIVLKTHSFRADKGSMLHSGIFSRELASSFVGAALALLTLLIFYLTIGLKLIYYVVAAGVFWVGTFFSRIFLFEEPFLETTIDKEDITILLNRPIRKRLIKKNKAQLKDIKIDYWRFEPDNLDAIEFVEKIALQHGTVIPGFGEVKEFYNLVLDFGEESFTVLTSENKEEVEGVKKKLKEFLQRT